MRIAEPGVMREMARAPRSTSKARTLSALRVAALAIVCVVTVLVGLAAWFLFSPGLGDDSAGMPVQIEVNSGATTAQIANTLNAARVIGSVNAFRLRARLTGADGKLRPGVYDLSTGMSDSDVLAALQAGPKTRYVSVTIPEGFVLAQIAQRFEEQAGVPAKEFLNLARGGAETFVEAHPYLADAYDGSLEGYLFPKTYRVRAGSSATEVIEMMLRQFDTEIASVDTTQATRRGLSFNDLVVLASMIERESKLDEERPLVSSVIHNRLAKNMLLEIDATIEYVLPGNRFRLRNSDLRIDSPYNTYRRKGLPPGPISNPGLASLKAAAAPADTEYLYYVLTGKDGSHTFAETKAEFLIAKQKSKEVFGR